ncbi:MAG: S8 family peptidase, partial [Candidatus Ranarchaeia archaeon]
MTKSIMKIFSLVMSVFLFSTSVFVFFPLTNHEISSNLSINSFSNQEMKTKNLAFLNYEDISADQYILVGQVNENVDDFYRSIFDILSTMSDFEITVKGKILPFVIIDVTGVPQTTDLTTLYDLPGVRTVIPNLKIMNLLGDSIDAQSNVDLPAFEMDLSRNLIDIDPLHDLGYKGAGVSIAIVDSGVDERHPDLFGTVVNRKSFVSTEYGWEDNEIEGAIHDFLGHGTGVAGVAAGRGNASNGLYVGVAPEADLINVKVFDGWGRTTGAALFAGIDWALFLDVDIISMSYGGGPPDPYADDVLAET